MIGRVGVIVCFYSPDLMLIETTFLKVKTSLKMDGIEEVANLQIALLETFTTIYNT